jgi:Flp pilus assembly pilin Flp
VSRRADGPVMNFGHHSTTPSWRSAVLEFGAFLRPRHRAERGAAAVEFALVLPLLVTLLLGTVDIGFILSDNTKLRAITRETARHAAVSEYGKKLCPGTYQTNYAENLIAPSKRGNSSQHLVCLARYYGIEAGLDVRVAVRVVKYDKLTGTRLPGTNALYKASELPSALAVDQTVTPGNSVVICLQMRGKSRSGFMGSLLDKKILKTRVEMEITVGDQTATGSGDGPGDFAEAPLDTTNGWSACDA